MIDYRRFFSRICVSLLQQALIRDNWRCVVTGIHDSNAPDDITAQLDFTECAHIIPESTFFGVNPNLDDNLKVRG